MQSDIRYLTVSASLMAVFTLLLLCGCSRKDAASAQFVESLVPVAGTVTQGGKPVSGVPVVYFVDHSTGASGSQVAGLTDADGKYSLMTYVPGSGNQSAPGAVSGDCRVMITKLVMPDGSPVPEGTTDTEAESLNAKQLLPPYYSSPTATQLTAKVLPEPTVKDFDLKK